GYQYAGLADRTSCFAGSSRFTKPNKNTLIRYGGTAIRFGKRRSRRERNRPRRPIFGPRRWPPPSGSRTNTASKNSFGMISTGAWSTASCPPCVGYWSYSAMSDNCRWHKPLFFRNLSHFCEFRLELGLWIKIPVKQATFSQSAFEPSAEVLVLQRLVRQLSMAQAIIFQELKSFLQISIRTWLMDQNPCETSHFLAIGVLTQR